MQKDLKIARMLIGSCIKLIAMLVLPASICNEHKKRHREPASGTYLTDEDQQAALEASMHDVTEIDNQGFRYIS